MSATYTLPWASTRDFVRAKIFDTNTAAPIFQDEELDGFLSERSGDGCLAAADALDAMAVLYARGAISWSVPGMSLNRMGAYKALQEMAKALRDQALQVPFEFESVLDQHVDTAGVDWSNYIDTPLAGDPPWVT